MVATAEIPILTPRTLDLLGEAIPPDRHRILRDSLDRMKPLFNSFLTEDDGENHESFVMASSRYAHPRLQVVLELSSSVDPTRLARLVGELSHYVSELLQREGCRLGDGLKHLDTAWDTYKRIGWLWTQNFATLNQIRDLPYGWLMASARMDFSLTATAMYLEGEFPNALHDRLSFLCQAAQDDTASVMTILLQVLYPGRVAEKRSQVLQDLFGSWKGDEQIDEENLKRLYESRRRRRTEPSS